MVTEAQGSAVRTWIGLHDFFKEGTFLWTDGSSIDFTKWNLGEPNNNLGNEDCAHFGWRNQFVWNDGPCNIEYSSICSYKLPYC
ncbi:C-type lectin lectoxin-Enh6-like [Scyliorhinus torazame]